MKHTLQSIMMGGGLLAFTAVPASAEVEFEVHAGYHSIYEFRGVDFGDDMIEAGVDFSTELGSGINLSGGVWYQDSDGNKGNAAFDELDLYVGLDKSFGNIDVSLGYTYYVFPGTTNGDTHEVYFGLATELDNGIGLGLTYYHDTDAFDAGYLEFEVTKSIEVPNNSSLSIDFSAGAAYSFEYNSDVDGSPLKGMNHYFASIAVPWQICDNTTLTPYVKYVAADSDFANSEDGKSDDLFLGGVVLSYSF
jgi:hypothetical protein